MTEAPAPRWYEPTDGGAKCALCARACVISRGSMGACGARGVSDDGEFVSPHLGRFVSAAVDPIEKKPLHHWRPGSMIYSLGALHCNAACPFCQNHEIAHPTRAIPERAFSPDDILRETERLGLSAVAFTYNEPTLQAELIVEASPLLREHGVATVLVTNGLFTGPRDDFAACVDAMNIDLKCFSRERYASLGGDLDTVLANVAYLAKRGVHVELTTLVVPGISDDIDEFAAEVDWIADLDADMPLHITRYHPAHKWSAPPTDIGLMRAMERIASARLSRVHLGNV